MTMSHIGGPPHISQIRFRRSYIRSDLDVHAIFNNKCELFHK